MSKKLLTVKEWAEKYCKWYDNKDVNLSPIDIIRQINYENDNNIENKIPNVQDLNDLYLKVEEGNFVYGGNIFDVMSDDGKQPNEDDAVGSNFIPITFLYCNIDEPYDCECPEDGDEILICDGSMSGNPGDEAWCNGTGAGVDGDELVCDGTGSGAEGDEPLCNGTNSGAEGDDMICDGSGTGVDGDDMICDGSGNGVEGDDGPICDGSASGADGDEEPDCDMNNACDMNNDYDEDESY